MLKFRLAAGALLGFSALAASITPGDARRGEQVFRAEQCIQCHSLNGQGGSSAPDLSRRIDRDFTPTAMAALMWNHAPAMWSAMQKQDVNRPALTPEKSADLFAYFVSVRFFEKPGDAARGKRAFAAQHCADCHGVTSSGFPGAPPVAKWDSLADPIALAQQMWNHGAKMRQAFAEKKLNPIQLNAQELTDILVYLQNLPETRQLKENFQFTASDAGENLFQSKGCAGCHAGANALENKLRNRTLTEIAVDMWNHQPNMKDPPALTQDEMRELLSYVWARQYFRGTGNAARGKNVFGDKKCASCHNQPSSGAPSLSKGANGYSDITMVSALWQHGPQMLGMMQQKSIEWPRFSTQEMADLIAYLNAQ